MTRYRLVIPGSPKTVIVYGFDRSAVGFFVVVSRGAARVVDLDGLGDDAVGVGDLVAALVRIGIFTAEDVAAAMDLLPHVELADIDDAGVRLAAAIIDQLRRDAAE